MAAEGAEAVQNTIHDHCTPSDGTALDVPAASAAAIAAAQQGLPLLLSAGLLADLRALPVLEFVFGLAPAHPVVSHFRSRRSFPLCPFLGTRYTCRLLRTEE